MQSPLIAILKTSGTGNEVMLYTTFKRILV